ncbi:MAG TPA: META domain-containing protein [Candidatus Limnocylindrales bacterium]|nr:META domain-containing protein [Candidatus Limnocylindrales bacterium]
MGDRHPGPVRAALVSLVPLAVALVLTACSGLAGGPGVGSPSGSGGSLPGHFSGRPIISPTAHPVPAGGTYLSIGVEVDGTAKALVSGTTISLTFSDDTVRASAGCNTFGASYRLDGQKLVVSGGASTAMGCDGPRMDQDVWFFDFLQAGPTLSWPDVKHLALTGSSRSGGSTVIRLADRELVEPDQPLTGRTWVLDGLVSGQTASSVPSGVKASIDFKTDGTFDFDSGCNAGGGRFVATGASGDSGSLAFSGILSTTIACREPQALVEGAFRAVVRTGTTVSYTIQGSRLRLAAGDQELDFRS